MTNELAEEKNDMNFKQLIMVNEPPKDKNQIRDVTNINLPLAFINEGYIQTKREVIHQIKNRIEPHIPEHKVITKDFKS